MRRHLTVTGLVVALLLITLPPTVAQTVTFLGSSMFLEAQSWWTQAGSSRTMHIHLGSSNSPLNRTISGNVGYDITLKLHHASGYAAKLLSSWSPDITGLLLQGYAESTVEQRTFQVVTNTSSATEDGWTPFTMQSSFTDTSGGPPRQVRLRGSAYVKNGKPLRTNPMKELEAHSWIVPSELEGRGYSNVAFHPSDVPFSPVSGTWAPRVLVGSSISGQTRHLFASVDPDIHAGNFGRVVANIRDVPKKYRSVPIDTRQLSNGPHKLMIKASDEGMFPSGTLEGVLVVGFVVQN